MSSSPSRKLLSVIEVAKAGGVAALAHYKSGERPQRKADRSPLTLADQASHEVISRTLKKQHPHLPVLSEESPKAELAERASWPSYWLVDPLDGTKEFLKESGEFTVNIALIEGNRPVLGVVHVPAMGKTYAGELGGSAFVDEGRSRREIAVRPADQERLVVVASRDHAGPEVSTLLERLGSRVKLANMGSSLKFCLVAEGEADFYPRLLPTMEWDTAAAQAVLEAAGGCLTDLDGRALQYNKPDLHNPSFLAFGDRQCDWASLIRTHARVT